jgi:hypothetical protein
MNDKINYKSAQYVLGSIGTLSGLYYAFSNKKGFWGYLGFAIIGGMAGSIIGGLYDNTMKPAVEKALPQPQPLPSDNDVKNDLVAVKPTTRPMQPSPVSADSKYDRTGMPLMQPSPVSAESDMMDTQMKNFL